MKEWAFIIIVVLSLSECKSDTYLPDSDSPIGIFEMYIYDFIPGDTVCVFKGMSTLLHVNLLNYDQPFVSVNKPGNFSITTNDNQVYTIYCKECEYHLEIPEYFTPNSDGINDFFNIRQFGVKKMKIKIFNGEGNEVYSSTHAEWDGRNCPEGLYYYSISCIFQDDSVRNYKGVVRLIR